MPLFKKKLSTKEFIDYLLLDTRAYTVKQTIDFFKNRLGYKGEDRYLELEANIFSLWLLTISLPPQNNELRDLLHDTYCKQVQLDPQEKKLFYEEVDKRYKIYFEAFNIWQKNPQSGHIMGGVLIEIIKNKTSNFSLKEYLPLVGANEALEAFILFGELFKLNLKIVGRIKNKGNYRRRSNA